MGEKSKRALIWAVHRPDRSPSQRFRFEQYISYLEANGFAVDFSYIIDAEADKTLYQKGKYWRKFKLLVKAFFKRWKELKRATEYDVFYVQREAFLFGTTYFENRMSRKVPMIFDFDDAIWLQNVSEANKRLAWLKRPEKTADLIKMATLVFAGNEYLAEYARPINSNVVIVPTTIDTDVYISKPANAYEAANRPVCIGWSGSVTTIQHFQFAEAFLLRLKQQFGDRITIKVIGDEKFHHEALGIIGQGWKKETELQDLSEFDIGIMPLPDDKWSKGKCGLKGLQYMALGIPTIMSPVGVNCEIIQHGENGMLATEGQWIEQIKELIQSPELRKKIGQEGRRTVERKYSVNAVKASYLRYFTEVAKSH